MNTETLKKRVLFPLLIMVFSALFVVFVLEAALRIVSPQQSVPSWLVPDKEYGYFQRKNYDTTYSYLNDDATWKVHLNEWGLRGPALDEPQEGERRVLLMGDSFTFGYGLEEEQIFATKLRRLLNEGGGLWRTINTGVGGWGTLQETRFVREHFEDFKPDIIVLTYCDNDIDDDILFAAGKASGLLPAFPGKQFLRDHSYAYRFLFSVFSDWLYARVLHEASDGPGHPLADQLPEEQAKYLPNLEYWARVHETIRSFMRDFLAYNPNGFLIIQQAQPYRMDIKGQLELLGADPRIRYVDLSSIEGLPAEDQLLLSYDPHWTEEVHDIVASNLAEVVRALPQPVGGR